MYFIWGDIHNHNEIGYGAGSIERSYEIAKGCLLDFYAFTPHGYWPDAPDNDPKVKKYHEVGYQKVCAAWDKVVEMAEKNNKPGKFVSLLAFEWHSSNGDYCAYLPDIKGATFPAENLDSLKDFAKQYNALLIPHHIAYRPGCRGLDWDNFDTEFSPVVEAFSEHACSIESQTPWPMIKHSTGGQERSQTVFSQLNKGMFFGIIGSTDNHHGHPASYGEGLTGLYVKELTREGVLQALKKRCSTVVSGDRIEVCFKLGDALMGELTTPAGDDSFKYSASCFSDIEFIQIIKNGIPVHNDLPCQELDKNDFAFRLEFGWGGMMSKDITDWDVEISIKNGEFLKLSPGFCGGADSNKVNKVKTFTRQIVKFQTYFIDNSPVDWIDLLGLGTTCNSWRKELYGEEEKKRRDESRKHAGFLRGIAEFLARLSPFSTAGEIVTGKDAIIQLQTSVLIMLLS